MVNITPVPSLSPAGWVTAAAEKIDVLLSHFFESVKSQTYIYGDNVTNLQWLIEQYGHSIVDLVQQMTTSLDVYLGRYYDRVVTTVTSNDDADNLNGSVTITIHCSVTDAGVQYSVGKLLQINNSTVINIINANNG